MKRLLLLLLLLPLSLFSQEVDSKYLAGAVPEVDGKVVFSQTLNIPNMSQDKIFDSMLEWANKYFQPNGQTNCKVLNANKEKGEIACFGAEYLILNPESILLNKALINYHLILTCTEGQCKIQISHITYYHQVSSSDQPEKHTAETWISDEYALNKNKDNLLRLPSRFRISTIDMVDKIFFETAEILNVPIDKPHKSKTTSTPSGNKTVENYKQIDPKQIPGNIIQMLSEDWMLITVGDRTFFNMATASWGGLGYAYSLPVAFSFIYPQGDLAPLLEENNTYTLSFYSENFKEALEYCNKNSGTSLEKIKATRLHPFSLPSGTQAFKEAWLIIECRTLAIPVLNPDTIYNPEVKAEWKNKPMHKLYIGEILNVWMK